MTVRVDCAVGASDTRIITYHLEIFLVKVDFLVNEAEPDKALPIHVGVGVLSSLDTSPLAKKG